MKTASHEWWGMLVRDQLSGSSSKVVGKEKLIECILGRGGRATCGPVLSRTTDYAEADCDKCQERQDDWRKASSCFAPTSAWDTPIQSMLSPLSPKSCMVLCYSMRRSFLSNRFPSVLPQLHKSLVSGKEHSLMPEPHYPVQILPLSLAVWLWTQYLIPQDFNLLIYKMEW